MRGITSTPIFPTRAPPTLSLLRFRGGTFFSPGPPFEGFFQEGATLALRFQRCVEADSEFWTLHAFMSMDFLPAQFPLDPSRPRRSSFFRILA